MGYRRRKLLQVVRGARAAGLALSALAMIAGAPPAARAVDEFATPAAPVPQPSAPVLKPKPIRPYIPHVAQKQCPKLVGQPLEAAKKIAAANGISLAPIAYRLADGPPGVIVDQAATARRGDDIYLCAVVVAQAFTVVVPKVIGMNVNSVQGALNDPSYHRLLSLARQWPLREFDQPPGTVLAQTPSPGTKVNSPTLINVVVAAPPAPVIVPQLVGTNVRDAPAALGDARYRKLLSLGRPIQQRESDAAPGAILEQTPPAGTKVNKPTVVYVAVAVPRQSVTVPKVVGMTQQEAETTLGGPAFRGWLTLVVSGSRELTLPPGTILEQSPPAGRTIYQPAKLVVAIARPLVVTVPNLVGLVPRVAGDRLKDDGFRHLLRLTVAGERTVTDRPPGTIVAQDPPAGTPVTRPTLVNAWVAAAPPPSVRVPNLSTLTPNAAGQLLRAGENRGLLDLGAQHRRASTARAGTIVDQKPPPQTPVTAPTKVEIWVAEAPPAVVVPNLVDFKPPDAKVQLASETFGGLLSLGDIREREADKPEGVIVAQIPGAGAKINAPTRIDVWVAASRLVVVPNLATLTRDGALAALTKVGLTLGDARRERRDGQAGAVIGQTPEAGRRVRVGTPVSIVLVAPPAFWKMWHLIAAALAVLLALAARAAWQHWKMRLSRVGYRAQEGGSEITLEAPEPAGRAVRLSAGRGTHETFPVEDGDTRPRRRLWPKTT